MTPEIAEHLTDLCGSAHKDDIETMANAIRLFLDRMPLVKSVAEILVEIGPVVEFS